MVHRRDEAVGRWRNWNREDLIWCRLLPFFSVSLIALLMVQVFFLILIRLMQNSERLGFPIFAVLGKGRPALTNSALRLMGGCRFYLRFIFPGWLVSCLLTLFIVKVFLLVVLMAGVGGSFRFCLFLGLTSLLVFLPRLRIWEFGLMGCWMLILP